jgi:anti-sigma regulatory factor (Ser/Thr protein kinase)
MNKPFFHFETIETPTPSVIVRFERGVALSGHVELPQEPLHELEEFFGRRMAKGEVHFIVDLQNVPFPTTRFIALLIAVTWRARRRHGDVKLINVTETARNNFASFNPINYLTVERPVPASANSAAHSLPKSAPGGTTAGPTIVRRPVINDKPVPDDNDNLDEEPVGVVDIVDPPLVKELGDEIENFKAPATENNYHLRVESRASNLYQLCDFVTSHAALAGISEKEIGKLRIAVYEACLNVIEHAYHSRPDEWIEVQVRYSPERFMIIIQDHGLSFEMKPPATYDVHEVMEKRRSGGFGLHIIQRAMDHVEYHPDTINGNRLIMLKRLS